MRACVYGSVCLCPSQGISPKPHVVASSLNFMSMLAVAVAVAPCFPGGVVVLRFPVSWMVSCLHVMGAVVALLANSTLQLCCCCCCKRYVNFKRGLFNIKDAA